MKTRFSLFLTLCVALLGSYVYAQFGDKPAQLSTIKIKASPMDRKERRIKSPHQVVDLAEHFVGGLDDA